MKTTRKQITVRFPDELDDFIQKRAEDNLRSVNAEIVYLLKIAQREIQELDRVKSGGAQVDPMVAAYGSEA
jgi:hypothetical protein